MKYFNKEWYELMQKQFMTDGITEILDKDYSNKDYVVFFYKTIIPDYKAIQSNIHSCIIFSKACTKIYLLQELLLHTIPQANDQANEVLEVQPTMGTICSRL